MIKPYLIESFKFIGFTLYESAFKSYGCSNIVQIETFVYKAINDCCQNLSL